MEHKFIQRTQYMYVSKLCLYLHKSKGLFLQPHHDGPLYLPVIATLTVGSHAVLNYYNPLEGTRAPAEEGSSALPSPSLSASSDTFSFSEESDASSSNAWASRYAGFSLYLEPRSLMLVSGQLCKCQTRIRANSNDKIRILYFFSIFLMMHIMMRLMSQFIKT